MKTTIEEIAQNIYRMETCISGLNTVFSVYFIKDKSSILIEPGPAAIIPAIKKQLKN